MTASGDGAPRQDAPSLAMTPKLEARDFDTPRIRLAGTVDYAMYDRFRSQLDAAPAEGLIVIELSTLGGDPEVARMMGEDVPFHSDIASNRRFVFLGKAAIYSAGATFMSFSPGKTGS
jgi:membrane-bound ClpP family serine protease